MSAEGDDIFKFRYGEDGELYIYCLVGQGHRFRLEPENVNELKAFLSVSPSGVGTP